MGLILLIFFPQRLEWQAALKKAKVKLDLLFDINLLLLREKGIRGGIYHAINGYIKANGK